MAIMAAFLASLPASAGISPYSVDAATLHLWHFDETAVPVVDYAPGGTNLTYLISGATLGNPSYATNSANFSDCISFGTVATPAAVIYPAGSANVGAAGPFTFAGANGAFTFEAVVHIEFNPVSYVRSQPCQIMNCDNDGGGNSGRIFQFRMDPVGFAAGGGDTNFVRIEFINGTSTVAMAPIPTNGPDVITSNGWYHVAVTYNGNAGATSNLLFYWTLLDPNRTTADCIYGTSMGGGLPGTSSATTIFSVGNSARNPTGGSGPDTANFLGKIDEVRLSSVARAPTEMLFSNVAVTIVSQPAPASQLIGTGQPFTLSVTAAGQAPAFQWRHNSAPVAGAKSASFTNLSAQLSDAGAYDVVITNNFSAVTSSVAMVTVTNLAIIAQPASIWANYAGAATFSVGAVGEQPLAYQWWQNGSPVVGATNSALALGPLAAANAGSYWAVVSNQFGMLTSSVATLTLAGPPVNLTMVTDGTNAAASGYAYAGSSAINEVAFICSGLKTVNNQQFFAFYGRYQTNPFYVYNNTIWIARRTTGAGTWQIFRTSFTADDITDGHDVVAFGIDGSNYMHLSWGMHDGYLHYARSLAPVTGNGLVSFTDDLGAPGMTGLETEVTYPQFLTMPNGDLLFLYRLGVSGGGNTWLNRWSLATQTWTNVDFIDGAPSPFIQGIWPGTNYNAYPNLPCLDANGNIYLAWTWRETPAYESNNNLLYAASLDGGVTWRRFDGTTYDLPISQGAESGDANAMGQAIVTIPQNYSLINQAGMCLDASNNPVIATWWAPGSGTNNFRRQYLVVYPGTNGVWQTRQVSNRTNDPAGTMELDAVVRDLGRPVIVADAANRLVVLYRDNAGSNGLTVAFTPPLALDPQRTNWTTMDLTTDNLGSYEPVIDLARWQRDNVLDIVYQASSGEGFTPATNLATPIGVLEWDAATFFNHHPKVQLTRTNATDVALNWNAQPGWGYEVQWSTNLIKWMVATTLNGTSLAPLQFVQTNGMTAPQRFWRIAAQQGGF